MVGAASRRSLLLAAGLLAPASGTPLTEEPRAVWLDVDPAVMRGGHEPDDGVAMVVALGSPELRVAGVSVVFGNAPLERGLPIAREIVRRFGPEGLSVHEGAAAPSFEPTAASRALIAALEREPLTVLVLGPATNVGAALRQRPDLADRIEELILVIGRRAGEPLLFPGSDRRFRDFNFELDPEAASVVLASGAPVVLAPFELAVTLPVGAPEWERLRGTPFGDHFLGPIGDYLDWFENETGIRATYPFDSYAVSWLLAPELLRCEEAMVAIREGPGDAATDRGAAKPWLVRLEGEDAGLPEGRPATWCGGADPALSDDLLRRLGAP